MKTYEVKVPIAGTAYIEVQAESEEAAITRAVNEVTMDHVNDWSALRRIVQGNICYADTWEATVIATYEEESDVPGDGEGK